MMCQQMENINNDIAIIFFFKLNRISGVKMYNHWKETFTTGAQREKRTNKFSNSSKEIIQSDEQKGKQWSRMNQAKGPT